MTMHRGVNHWTRSWSKMLLVIISFQMLYALRVNRIIYPNYRCLQALSLSNTREDDFSAAGKFISRFSAGMMIIIGLSQPVYANSAASFATPTLISSIRIPIAMEKSAELAVKDIYNKQSKGWEIARQKRTNAIKSLEQKGIVTVETDDSGNQFLSLPWIPDSKIPYKSLSFKQRLLNEVCAGAFGEISKDFLLHSIDTAKTRRQAKKKQASMTGSEVTDVTVKDSLSNPSETANEKVVNALRSFKDLYAGFPVVMITSIPQGGMFFLVKKGSIEYLNTNAPDLPNFLASAIPIGS